MDASVVVCMTADEEKQQHMDASPPLPHCRESSRRSNSGVPNPFTYGSSCSFVGLILLIPFPHFPCMARQWAPYSAPRSRRAPPRGGISTASVRLGSGPGCLPHHCRRHAVKPRVRPRIRFREPASTTSKKQDIMGVFLLWPRTPFPLHPPPLPSSCFCYMAMVAGGSQRRRVLLVEDNEVNRVRPSPPPFVDECNLDRCVCDGSRCVAAGGGEKADQGDGHGIGGSREWQRGSGAHQARQSLRSHPHGQGNACHGWSRGKSLLPTLGSLVPLVLYIHACIPLCLQQATRQLRSLGVTTPIVALSGNTLQSDRDSFLEAGADHFEAKVYIQLNIIIIIIIIITDL
ncbi:hypothetical protein B296_00030582 [Ensete ventricosum]|uniref:Response regulatory domain-containing protein n=1 Tax=Ensete ventricosum TaxID=4639 RepID=A0A426Z6T5_ENSVE|nr:hypothetical protein B296_00030582 [Ensete ventricosum]